jgi:hypothetical protein
MDAELRDELLRRADLDQTARRDPGDNWNVVASIDADNLQWLRGVVAEHGWPGESLVGAEAANAAWLLAQHADHDPAFQRECLELLTTAAEKDEATPVQLAYLTDRVLIAEGKPQEYGTQVIGRKDGWEPLNLRDPQTVDERRASVGLGSLAAYLASFEDQGVPLPSNVPCPECGTRIEFWTPGPGEQVEIACSACGWTSVASLDPPK